MALRAIEGGHGVEAGPSSPSASVPSFEEPDTDAGPERTDRRALCELRARQAEALVLACGVHQKSERWMAARAGVSRALWRGYTSGAKPIDGAAVAAASPEVFRTWSALNVAALAAPLASSGPVEKSLPRLVQDMGALAHVLEDERIGADECEVTTRIALDLRDIADRLLRVAQAGGTGASGPGLRKG